MTSRVLPLAGVALFVSALAGCAGLPLETSSEPAVTASSSSSSSEEKRSSSANEERHTEKREQTASTKADPDAPRSSWRAERDSQREARTSSAGGSDNAKLVEQLNEATRELATLRAANAKLRAERGSAAPATTSSTTAAATRNDAMDEKLAASLKSYAQFKQEMVNVFAELERLRRETSGVNGNLKAAVDQAEQSRAALARAEADLRAEKRSRAEAEKTVAQLREQLRNIAKALSSAGLSVDKLAATADR